MNFLLPAERRVPVWMSPVRCAFCFCLGVGYLVRYVTIYHISSFSSSPGFLHRACFRIFGVPAVYNIYLQLLSPFRGGCSKLLGSYPVDRCLFFLGTWRGHHLFFTVSFFCCFCIPQNETFIYLILLCIPVPACMYVCMYVWYFRRGLDPTLVDSNLFLLVVRLWLGC